MCSVAENANNLTFRNEQNPRVQGVRLLRDPGERRPDWPLKDIDPNDRIELVALNEHNSRSLMIVDGDRIVVRRNSSLILWRGLAAFG